MSKRDERIGKIVQQLRGDMSQSDLAKHMRDRGWKWTQTTVWNVEKGERPLRLSEAEDIAAIAETSLFHFTRSAEEITIKNEILKTHASLEAVKKALEDFEEQQFDLALYADQVPEESIGKVTDTELRDLLGMKLESIVETYRRETKAERAKEEVLHGKRDSPKYSSGNYADILGISSNIDMGRGLLPEQD